LAVTSSAAQASPRAIAAGQPTRRLLAFYLPQFHPIPENDAWWGPGFTEWTNVTRARPLFRGHQQPQLPTELGFYDLRVPEVREAQAELAREHGVHGFCWYHYWFNGRRLLERPFDEVLRSGRPDFPFCLCWANENWTRTWDGGDTDVLVPQAHGEEDDRAHLRWLAEAFSDPRYIRVDGRPVFLVYHAAELPDPRRTIETWRHEASRLGIPDPYLLRVESHVDDRGDPIALGFDAAVEFQPDGLRIGPRVAVFDLPGAWIDPRWYANKARRAYWRFLVPGHPYRANRVHDYRVMVEKALEPQPRDHLRYRCVNPGWDNSPRRRSDAKIMVGSTPDLYREWLTEILRRFQPPTPDENLVFVNAWNEWAEGNHLEPDRRWGRAYLEATRDAFAAAGVVAG
jgi:lipopolysaccharide biosynthesis protein